MPKQNAEVGIITAVPHELEPYFDQLENIRQHYVENIPYYLAEMNNTTIALIACGWGTCCASAVMTHLYCHFKPKAIFFSGTAGAINLNLSQGDVVIGRSAMEIELFSLINKCIDTPYEKGLLHSFKNEIQPKLYYACQSLLALSKKLISHSSFKHCTIGNLATSNNFPLRQDDYTFLVENKIDAYAMVGSAIY